MRRFAAVALLLLTACQTAVREGDEESPYYPVPVGTKLVLHRDLTVPAHDAGVYLQAGEVRTYWRVKPYHPFCALDLRRRRETPQTVHPDEFTVTHVNRGIVYSVRADSAPPVALERVAAVEQGGASYEIYATLMTLRSERQPDVLRLTCAQWQYPPFARHVTISEMRKTLGDLFTLRLGTGGD